jgi:hypothetical protein
MARGPTMPGFSVPRRRTGGKPPHGANERCACSVPAPARCRVELGASTLPGCRCAGVRRYAFEMLRLSESTFHAPFSSTNLSVAPPGKGNVSVPAEVVSLTESFALICALGETTV